MSLNRRPDLRRRARTAPAAAVLVALVLRAAGAEAYDPATTHAGLTERAVLASSLHRMLVHRLARPLGLFEPIALHASDLPLAEREALAGRLAALDPSEGYRPGPQGTASALAWVIAGSVIAKTPAERGQHLYYDPSRGSGLSDSGGLRQVGLQLRQLVDAGGGGMRALATGTSFNMTGLPSTEWLLAEGNDVGLRTYYAELETAVSAEDPGRRSTALARALLALGGTLAVLEDAGEPAHVRNDFQGAYLGGHDASPFDRGSAFERFVAETYGRAGIPAATAPVERPTVMAFITGADRQGLADRTQRGFFSAGSLPEDAIVDRETTTVDVLRDARQSLPYAYPRLPRLALHEIGERRYAYAPDATADGDGVATKRSPKKPAGRRLLAYERVPGRVHFFLDRAVYADTARVLLPEIGGYGAGLVDHLLRVDILLETKDGIATVAVSGAHGAVRDGQVRLYAEDQAGRRRALTTVDPAAGSLSVTIPAGTRRLAAVLRGHDDGGELVAVAETPVR